MSSLDCRPVCVRICGGVTSVISVNMQHEARRGRPAIRPVHRGQICHATLSNNRSNLPPCCMLATTVNLTQRSLEWTVPAGQAGCVMKSIVIYRWLGGVAASCPVSTSSLLSRLVFLWYAVNICDSVTSFIHQVTTRRYHSVSHSPHHHLIIIVRRHCRAG